MISSLATGQGLAGSGAADEHDIVGGVGKVTTVKLPDQRFIDLAVCEVEAGQVAIGLVRTSGLF
jgi:hypothetical protein